MTIRDLGVGQLVLVRATVVSVFSQDALCEIQTDLRGNRRRVAVPFSDIVQGPSVDAAYEAMRVLLQKVHDLEQTTDKLKGLARPIYDVGARVMAEIAELGVLTGTGKTGLCGCGLIGGIAHE